MIATFQRKVEALTAPHLRWRWLTITILSTLIMVVFTVSLVMPPYGNATLKAAFLMLFTLIAMCSAICTVSTFVAGDDHAERG